MLPVAPMPALTYVTSLFGKAWRNQSARTAPHCSSRREARAPDVMEPPMTATTIGSPFNPFANTRSRRAALPSLTTKLGYVSSRDGTRTPEGNFSGRGNCQAERLNVQARTPTTANGRIRFISLLAVRDLRRGRA